MQHTQNTQNISIKTIEFNVQVINFTLTPLKKLLQAFCSLTSKLLIWLYKEEDYKNPTVSRRHSEHPLEEPTLNESAQ